MFCKPLSFVFVVDTTQLFTELKKNDGGPIQAHRAGESSLEVASRRCHRRHHVEGQRRQEKEEAWHGKKCDQQIDQDQVIQVYSHKVDVEYWQSECPSQAKEADAQSQVDWGVFQTCRGTSQTCHTQEQDNEGWGWLF